MVNIVRHDLEFILRQIKIAEAHSSGTPLDQIYVDANGNVVAANAPGAVLAISHPLAPAGLRTVDGSYNNMIDGRSEWGAADNPFAHLADPSYRNETDDSIGLGPGQVLTNGNYGSPGSVVDADPRLISNLIVDQTLDNPAAIYAALAYAGAPATNLLTTTQAIHAAFETAKAAFIAANPGATPLQAVEAATASTAVGALLATHGIEMEGSSVVLPNVAPDEGLSAPFNSWFTLFGQFFDHGLDLVAKQGSTIYIPLSQDDPLYNPASPQTNFMVLTRTTPGAVNLTTPFVDQNQTYSSTASKQLFMREYDFSTGEPLSTGRLLSGANGLATWADVKAQALKLGFQLTDADVGNIPLFAMDEYGEYIRGTGGLPQVIAGLRPDGSPILVSGNLLTPVNVSAIQLAVGTVVATSNPNAPNTITAGETVSAVRTGHAFIDDIAHNAVFKGLVDPDRNPGTINSVMQTPDSDTVAGNQIIPNAAGVALTYDDELLNAHYVTGDGRGNENIGLSAVHHVFHSEHNRTVEQIKQRAIESGDAAFLNEWLRVDVAANLTAAQVAALNPASLAWDGERLFQAARFTTEMQYQHLVFEEFARKVQPDVDAFVFNPSTDINPAIFAEFAHVIYRFGHSMLREDVAQTYADGTSGDLTLFDAFLNPLAFGGPKLDANGNPIAGTNLTHDEAAGAIVRGMTSQHGNEIDEFVTNVLRNQLLGIPLDLAAINIARGRDTGMPSLNEAREQFRAMANGDSQLDPYTSWTDFALNMKNPASIVNFVAAYGTHETITGATTSDAKRDAAMKIVFGGTGAPVDRLDFLNAKGAYAGGSLGGLNDVDLWVGGLAEKKMPFGGMLGSTFAFVFELQLENLQNGDRFYYLSRVQGLNFLNELENNSFAKMVLNNTDLGAEGYALPGDIFSVPDHVIYMDARDQAKFRVPEAVHEDPFLQALSAFVERRDAAGNLIEYQRNPDGTLARDPVTGNAILLGTSIGIGQVAASVRVNTADHVLIQGTDGDDVIVSGGGDDSVWGRGGNDRIEAGYGVDKIHGGDGDDIITNSGTDIGATDMLHGEGGNDVIHAGSGLALVFGNEGKDVLITGPDGKEAFGGLGDDFILGGEGGDFLLGNEGDDWIEGGGGFDTTAGDNSELFFNSTIIGHDVMFAGTDEHDFDAESGDDIMVQGESVMRNEGMLGFDWAIHKGNPQDADDDLLTPIFTTDAQDILRDRFDAVEALSGWTGNDSLKGDNRGNVPAAGEVPAGPPLAGAEGTMVGHELSQAGVNRIDGLRAVLGDWASAQPAGATLAQLEALTAFDRGNILLGGAGNDVIEGRGGDDVIDGDAWLNVKIVIKDTSGLEIATTDGLTKTLVMSGAAATNPLYASWAGRALSELMVSGAINPTQLNIGREIRDHGTGAPGTGTDTAVFWDASENYTFSRGADGSYIVSHTGFDAANRPAGTNFVSDGIDKLWNIERLRFSDGEFSISQLFNELPTGAPVINDANGGTPTEGQGLTVSTAGIADGNGIVPPFSYQWQLSTNGGTTWTNIANATGATFTPTQAQVAGLLRIGVSFTDGAGNLETVFSAQTGVVGDDWDAVPVLFNTFNGTAGDDIADGTSGFIGLGANDTLNGNAGNDILNGAGGTDTLNGGAGDDRLDGGAGNSDVAVYAGLANTFGFSLNGTGQLVVTHLAPGAINEGTDTLTTIEQLRFAGTTYALVNGSNAAGTSAGGAGADIILGHGGADTLTGAGGNDILVGGAGNDTVNGGAGNDLALIRVNDGRDFIDGGANTDTVHIMGNDTAEIFRIYSRAAADAAGFTGLNANTEIVITRNGTGNASIIAELDNIEEIVINGLGGGDTFTPIGSFVGTSLATSTITIEGGTGNDQVDVSSLLSAHRIVFKSNGGNDTILGTLRTQDEIQVPAGTNLTDYVATANANGTTTLSNGTHSITYATAGTPTIGEEPDATPRGAFEMTARDLEGLKKLVNGQMPFDDDDDAEGALGPREVSGHGNNEGNPSSGQADTPFIRLTDARYGAADASIGNRGLNPIYDGLDPRAISNILGAQEAGLPHAGNNANIFFMAFGQYVDHGLDFLPKNAANGTIQIGAPGTGHPGQGNPADLTRGEVYATEGGVPQHLNKTSAYVDQNQAYGSHNLVTQFLREGDGNGGLTSHLLKGAVDPSNPSFNLLPTLREAIQHHWANNTVFHDPSLPGGQIAFRDYYSNYPISEGVTGDLVDQFGGFDPQVYSKLANNFMGSSQALLLDSNPFISLLDHYVAGDGRTNENFALTSMHTIWARNHNFHADQLEAAGFEGTEQELFDAAKIINEAEYQRVVFNEYADTLLGGLRSRDGSGGDHGHDGYNAEADAGVSHEFAAAAFRFGHSLIGQTLTVMDANGQPKQVNLVDAFLNPTNDASAFPNPLPPGYVPQPGYAQYGVGAILQGVATQPAEEVDFNIVDAVRNDLVRIQADLFSFNLARGRDVGLGTLNQIRNDLATSTNSYVREAVGFAGNMSAYQSWEDFQQRNGLSDVVIAQFKQAYPDLVLDTPAKLAAFVAANPDIQLVNGNTVKGIDRVDFWLGGLAEQHVNGGIVGQTFWVVLHEQFDRLQEADRFYYKDRLEAFDFYDAFIDGQEFSDIVARNTGLTDLAEHIFEVDDEDDAGNGGEDDDEDDEDDDGTPTNPGDDDEDEDDEEDEDDDEDDDDDDDPSCGCGDDDEDDDGPGTPAPNPNPSTGGALRTGTAAADVLIGTANADNLIGLAGDDTLIGDAGADAISAGEGEDFIDAGDGRDVVFAGAGDDQVFGGGGVDMLYGEAGNDRIFGGAGNDLIEGGTGNDTVVAGAGDDRIIGAPGDGDDTYFGDEIDGGTGIDTLDFSTITANLTVDLGNGLNGRGSAASSQSGTDTLWSIENVATGSGSDVITASDAVNVMEGGTGNDTFRFLSTVGADGDTILDFQPGDRLDLSAIDADAGQAGNQSFTLVNGGSFTTAAQLTVTYETRVDGEYTIVKGNVDGATDAEFQINLKGSHNLTANSFTV
ncbi:peroxidase family protein [Bosea beijingensis]|uniref:peroxidase family protein n=1 Tax=Bosea beijingensis TaxID=3068632 RepID=UPI0027416169|nr:peroxidase family protein [Bosea sp. REN20]